MLDNETNLYQYCYNSPVLNADVDGMGPTDCTDPNLIMIEDPFGSSYICEKDDAVPGTAKVATYRLNGTKIYFNCYMWAIGKYKLSYSFYNPGYLTNVTWNSSMSVDRVAKLALLDLQRLNHKVLSCTTYIASVNVSNPGCMAVRINSSDYHFMSRTSFRGGIWWSFKSGKTGPTFRILNQMGPNSIEWKQYVYNGSNWVSNSIRYTNPTYYLVYK